MTAKRAISLLSGVLVLLVAAAFTARTQVQTSIGGPAPSDTHAPSSTKSPMDSIDPSKCGRCHSAEVAGFALSAMSHSMRRSGAEADGKVQVGDTTISVYSSATGTWQRLQRDGHTTEYHVDYVVGSGKHANGYLVAIHNHLFQSPIAYYKSRHGYDVAPGYETQPEPDFTRAVTPACLFCHAGRADPVAGTANDYKSPPFSHLAIGCSRCHGATEGHLAHPGPATIVNPARLQGSARDSICEQCHLLGVARILNPGKQFNDFRPGTPLEDTFTVYRNILPSGTASKFRVISHVEQLALSKCVRESGGRLWCGTCHDPHRDPIQPAAFYRSKCLACHTTALPKPHPANDSGCISCHMPKRDAKDGGHTAFTDHRIQRQEEPEEAVTEENDIAAWREPADSILQKRNLGIAYIQVGMERHSSTLVIRGYRLLSEVQGSFSTDPGVYASIGTALLSAKRYPEAQKAFGRAFELDPGSSTAEADLGQSYAFAGESDTAVRYLEDSLAKDPLNLAVATLLMEIYDRQGEAAKAADLSHRMRTAMK
jgi:hypothetical protein